ncbi:MAG TPA: polysaccharide biosynthesis C-terminal domain-containing protein [Allosphingosinicella sp.]|nr:polysaccharide biosynthesis C-terminal domain-containing protein [Allosphingosinicella sp.]
MQDAPPAPPSQPAVTRGEVARGAGLAGLSRAGALIEALAQPLYTWLFGIATYGIYVVLWGAVSLITNIVDLSMTSALQRVVPTQDREELAHGAVKLALIVSVAPAALIALLVSWNAASVAAIFSAAPEDAAQLPRAIALFAWALPLWTFVEVATSAARARRAFGPEIRLRIFWEQIARIGFAIGFFLLGFHSIGLMLAHLASLALTALLCIPLLARYYRLSLLVRAPVPGALARNLLASGAGLLPANLARRLLIDAPPVVLNLTIPGAAGAAAAGLFEIARKLSTVPNIVRQAFQYVLGPLSSAQAHADRGQVAPLYRFASRVSTALVVPLCGLLVFAGVDILSVYRAEALAALPLLWVLVAARGIEAIVGPASTIVEMIGHRALPLLNSAIAIALWVALMVWLIPDYGPLGMAIAVAVAVVASTWAATVELQLADNLSPFDRKLFQGLAIALIGLAVMAGAEWLLDGPARFATVFLLWAITSWLALRHGLTREDREALGGLSRRLRLV